DFGFVSLKVYDVLGNLITTLVDEYKNPGSYEVEINTSNLKHQTSSGIYFYQLIAGNFSTTKTMLLIK
ncbi:MAG: T9SS type A sorting domain-containing protein, partial [Ignavibacteriaceae bacterium]